MDNEMNLNRMGGGDARDEDAMPDYATRQEESALLIAVSDEPGYENTGMRFDEDEVMGGDGGAPVPDAGGTIVIVEEVVTPILIVAEGYAGGGGAQSDGTTPKGRIERVKSAINSAGESIGDTLQGAAKSSVRTAKQVGAAAVGTVRQNPIPAALVGVGVGWLLLNAVKGGGRKKDGQTSAVKSNGAAPQHAAKDEASRTADAAGDLADQAQGTVKRAAGKAQNAAGQILEAAQGVAGGVAHAGRWFGGQVVEKTSHLPAQVADKAKRAGSYAQQTLSDKPLAAGAIALGVGAGIGLALPRTRVEGKLMGEAKDKLLDKVGSAVQGAVDKVQKIAE